MYTYSVLVQKKMTENYKSNIRPVHDEQTTTEKAVILDYLKNQMGQYCQPY